MFFTKYSVADIVSSVYYLILYQIFVNIKCSNFVYFLIWLLYIWYKSEIGLGS